MVMAKKRFSVNTPLWVVTLLRPIVLLIMIAGITFSLPEISRGARNRTQGKSATTDRIVRQNRTPTVLMAAEKKSGETSTSREGTTVNKRNMERWQNLPSDEKRELRNRMDKFQNLPPREQDKYRRRNQKLQELTPIQRKKINQGLEKGDALSPTEKEEIRRVFEE